MKKLLLSFFVLLTLIVAAIYIFIPAKIHFRKSMYVKTAPSSAARFLLDEKAWHKWWPANSINKSDTLFTYKQYNYFVNWKMIMGDSVRIKTNDGYINSLINIIPVSKDSMGFQWEGESTSETNIFKRLDNYFAQKKLRNNVDEIFKALKNYVENEENVYGIKIAHKMVVDTLLISTKKTFNAYPKTEQIYEMINDLKKYMASNAVFQTNPPMLHVVVDSGMFKTMVAIPISKTIPNSDQFTVKKMIAGKILITEIKGGSANAEATIKKVEMYMDDYHILSPAISFQSLVTDRLKETDSTKWVTKIYYPIMN
jgi:effector-binding domain-containing protein